MSTIPPQSPGTYNASYVPEGSVAGEMLPSRYNNIAPPRRALRVHHVFNFVLYVLTALATGAAIPLILTSNETTGPTYAFGVEIPGVVITKWKDYDAFIWLFVADCVVCGYAVLAAIASLVGFCTPSGPLSSSPLAWLTFVFDLVLVNALMSAAASATALIWLQLKGVTNTGINIQGISDPSLFDATTLLCNSLDRSCWKVGGACIASYVAWLFLALSTGVVAAALQSQRRKRLAY